MAKQHPGMHIVQTMPTGKITDAARPIPVLASVRWHPGSTVPDIEGWAMAWTAHEVLFYWRTPPIETANLAWLSADQVRRR